MLRESNAWREPTRRAVLCRRNEATAGLEPPERPSAPGAKTPNVRAIDTIAPAATMAPVNDLKWDSAGLIATVAQDRLTGQVRMVAWMNREALDATLGSGFATFYSRSRGALWRKGESSGHLLRVHEVVADCDGDTLLLLVDPEGPSCHTGRATCFFRRLERGAAVVPTKLPAPQDAGPFLLYLEEEIKERAQSTAERSYTRSLLDGGVAKISGKITEEAAELNAALAAETEERVASEAADLLYHMLVGLRARGVEWRRVMEALAGRAGQSGHAEKASRQPR